MKLLILGGTRFAGRFLTEYASARGDDVTVFHRGTTRFPLPPGVREVFGDRETALAQVLQTGAHWDAVIDMCAFRPQTIASTLDELAGRFDRYLFISSVSAYGNPPRGAREDAPLAELPAEAGELPDVSAYYGALKAACEREAVARLGKRATVVRPTLIAGPYDPTDRFTYWVERMLRGGDVLAPGRPGRGVQFIDARDVAEFCLRLLDRDMDGAYNAAGPLEGATMGSLLDAGSQLGPASAPVRLVWLGDETLLEAGVTPWTEMPLWIPDGEGDGLMYVDLQRAKAAGLRTRPAGETFAGTAAWVRTLPAGRERAAGLDQAKERSLLDALRGASAN